MASYSEQINSTESAHMVSRAISDATVVELRALFYDLEKGNITTQTYLTRAKSLVTTAYRDSAKAGRELTKHLSDVPGWVPDDSIQSSDYLKSLLRDVERNVKTYSEGVANGDESAIRQLRLRVELSAITAAERGFTDAQLKHYGELEQFGYKLQKMWLANFINNEPCDNCIRLHGVVVDFDKEFPVPTLMKTAIYRDLQGPPLHVRCKCVQVVLIKDASNMFDKLPKPKSLKSAAMSTDTVKAWPKRMFNTLIKFLRAITGRNKK